MDARRWNIGLVGYREVGRILAEDLRAQNVAVQAFDLKLHDPSAANQPAAVLERRPPRPSPQPSPASGRGGIAGEIPRWAEVVRAGHVTPE